MGGSRWSGVEGARDGAMGGGDIDAINRQKMSAIFPHWNKSMCERNEGFVDALTVASALFLWRLCGDLDVFEAVYSFVGKFLEHIGKN
jgi:hypothetical protein